MSSLEQQIEKLPRINTPNEDAQGVSPVSYVSLSDVLGLVADCVCIPRKQLEEMIEKLSHKPVPQPFRADNFRTGWLDGVSLGVKQLRKLLDDSK